MLPGEPVNCPVITVSAVTPVPVRTWLFIGIPLVIAVMVRIVPAMLPVNTAGVSMLAQLNSPASPVMFTVRKRVLYRLTVLVPEMVTFCPAFNGAELV